MIRNNPLAVVLVSVLFLLSLLSCWFAAWWFFGARELQMMRLQYQFMNKITSTVQSLANEAADYSRKNRPHPLSVRGQASAGRQPRSEPQPGHWEQAGLAITARSPPDTSPATARAQRPAA